MSCSVPKQGLVVRGISPQTKEPYFLPESSVSGEGSYNKQLVGGDYISGQGNKGGDGDVFLRDPKNDTYVMQRAGGGGGAGGPGENAQVDIPVPLKLGANGGIGRNLTDIVGGDLGQTGFFGGGGGAYFGNGKPDECSYHFFQMKLRYQCHFLSHLRVTRRSRRWRKNDYFWRSRSFL